MVASTAHSSTLQQCSITHLPHPLLSPPVRLLAAAAVHPALCCRGAAAEPGGAPLLALAARGKDQQQPKQHGADCGSTTIIIIKAKQSRRQHQLAVMSFSAAQCCCSTMTMDRTTGIEARACLMTCVFAACASQAAGPTVLLYHKKKQICALLADTSSQECTT